MKKKSEKLFELLTKENMRNILGGTGTEPPPETEFPVDPPSGTIEIEGEPMI